MSTENAQRDILLKVNISHVEGSLMIHREPCDAFHLSFEKRHVIHQAKLPFLISKTFDPEITN